MSRELSRESPKVSGRLIKSSRVSINGFCILIESSRDPRNAFCRLAKSFAGSKRYLEASRER